MKIKVLNERKFNSLVRRNAYSISRMLEHNIQYNKDKELFTSDNLLEKVTFEPDDRTKGGIIVFSYEVNAVEMSKNKIINWAKHKLATLSNKIRSTDKIDSIANQNNLQGWTIGKYLNGRYTAKNGKTYGENSLSLEIIGVDTDTLINIAETICKDFKQESALVKDYSTGRVMFVEP